ncbi:AAA family ATPase, partial [Candidatus Bathyarchaeota archaeon]|nr:AAA family ATPase [Candidatus Bathyarchaeota archaeon]
MKHETRDPKNDSRIVLESLELENFLSFRKEKVSFLMDDGNVAPFTIITGPNGAGKSSIFQALKFVLSSNSKDGRYTKWEEFINHGEDFLRVRATFKSNKDGLFKIERLLRRGRSTQYFLNNDQVRSNKIQDFATKYGIKPDNPFSFIRQGHVTAIKDLSREQIYYLIETGIGIKNLRDEITARSRELESLEQEIKSLAIQEKTCERNEQILKEKMLLLKEKRQLEHKLTKANAEKKWAQRINIINKITSIETNIDEIKKNIENILEKRNKIEQKNKEIKKSIRENEEARREQEIEIRLKRKEMKSIRAVIAGWNDEKRELFEKNEAMKVRKEELTLKLQELEQLMEKLLEEIKTKDNKMEELSVQKKMVIKERDSIHERLLENREWLQRHEKLRYRVESIEKDIANNDKMLEKIERETNSLMKQHDELGNEIGSFDWYFDPSMGPNPKNHLDARLKKINSIIKDLQVRLQVKQREEIKLKQKLGTTIGNKGNQGLIPGAISRLRKELDSRD